MFRQKSGENLKKDGHLLPLVGHGNNGQLGHLMADGAARKQTI